MMATLSSLSWGSVVRGMDEGFRSTSFDEGFRSTSFDEGFRSTSFDYTKSIDDRLTIHVINHCWRLFQLQQSFCSAGFTIAKPIALGLIGINLFSKCFIQTILYGYETGYKNTIFTDAAVWLQTKIDPAVADNDAPSYKEGRKLFYWSNCVTNITPFLLIAGDFLEGFIQLEKNWTQGFAKIATMSALYWSFKFNRWGVNFNKFSSELEQFPIANFLSQHSLDILNVFVRTNVKICAVYQNSIVGNFTSILKNIACTAAGHISSGHYRELLNIDSTNLINTLNNLNHIYQIVGTVRISIPNVEDNFED